MSKIKESLLKQQEEQMVYMGKFFDYLYDNVISLELSDEEINKMESQTSHPNKVFRNLSNFTLKQVNNKNYHPLKGA